MNEQTFDPEVVRMLEEIASDAGSTLLKLPKRPLRNWIASPEEVVSPHGSHLTKAEKHLVMAYREEAAWVLLQAAIEALRDEPLLFGAPEEPAQDLPGRAMKSLERHRDVQELCNLSEGASPSAVSLARASLALIPRDRTRNVLGVSLERSGHDQEALVPIERVLTGHASATQRAQALENKVTLLNRRDEYARSIEYAEKAHRAEESIPRLVAWCLTTSLQCGDASRIQQHARSLVDHPRAHELATLPAMLIATRKTGFWRPTRQAARLAESQINHSHVLLRGLYAAFIS